jgi:hypothetical protein
MTILDRAAGAALGLSAIAAVVWGANVPMTVHESERAVVRLAWSVRPERVESCRQQSEEELARLPAHMRQPVVCEGASAQYRLTVRLEGRIVTDEIVHGGGLRQDRRIYVFHELPLDPGDAAIDVRFDRIDPDSRQVTPPGTGDDDQSRAENGRNAAFQARGEAVPPHLAFAQRLHVRPREVILVSYSAEQRALVGIQDGVRPPQ